VSADQPLNKLTYMDPPPMPRPVEPTHEGGQMLAYIRPVAERHHVPFWP
jgi:hypothetical protein